MHLIKDGQPTATCPYCDETLEGLVIDGLHKQCSEQFGRDLDEVFGDEDPVFEEVTEWERIDEKHRAEQMIDDLIQQTEAN